MGIRTNRFLKESTMLLLLWIIGSVSAYYDGFCVNSTALVDFSIGIPTLYHLFDMFDPSSPNYEEAAEWWAGQVDDDGNCIEPLFGTYSCDPLDWSTYERNATLFTCSEADNKNGVPATCIDLAFVCSGLNECPNGEDEAAGGFDCSEFECLYSEIKCESAADNVEGEICLPNGWLCDGYSDCRKSEDEEGCSY